tara:strand:- start:320 stop:1036 length:717 start_codon:yes stop_codon:yes gene_type:complete
MSDLFKKISYFDTLDSSSDYLIDLFKKFQVNTELVVVTKRQKKGRGRFGKSWFSDENSLVFSFSFLLSNQLTSWHLNMAVLLSLIHILTDYGIHALIKYPNDIIVNKKKIAGVLTEIIPVRNKKYCIIGIGLNVNNQLFPQNIPHAVSIKNLTLHKIDKQILLNSFLKTLRVMINKQKIQKFYMHKLYGFKDYINAVYKGNNICCKILSITSKGFLTIKTSQKHIVTVNDVDIKFLIY